MEFYFLMYKRNWTCKLQLVRCCIWYLIRYFVQSWLIFPDFSNFKRETGVTLFWPLVFLKTFKCYTFSIVLRFSVYLVSYLVFSLNFYKNTITSAFVFYVNVLRFITNLPLYIDIYRYNFFLFIEFTYWIKT